MPDPSQANSGVAATAKRLYSRARGAAGRFLARKAKPTASKVFEAQPATIDYRAVTGAGRAFRRTAKALENAPSYKRGGRVRRTGPAKLHKGERVIRRRSRRR